MSNHRKSILQWAEQGRINAEDAEEAMRVSGVLPDRADWRLFIDRLLLWTGSVLFAAGVIFFIAYNWKELGNFARFGMAEALVLIAVGCCLWFGTESPAGKAALFAASLLTGALLALFGQTYQTGADTFELFITWAVAILPWTVLSRLPALWILLIALVNVAVTFYFQAFPGLFGLLFSTEKQLWLLFVLNCTALALWEILGKYIIWLNERWALRLLNFACGSLITALTVAAIFNHDFHFRASFVVYPLWIAEIYVYYRNFKLDLFVLAGGVLSFIIVVAALFGRGIIDNADWAISYLIIGFIVVGLSALGGFWLKAIAREEAK